MCQPPFHPPPLPVRAPAQTDTAGMLSQSGTVCAVMSLPEDEDLWEMILWRESYCTGHPDIDQDHQHLVSLFNAFSAALNAGKSDDMIRSVLDELADYCRYHFEHEEMLMQETDYPDYDRHKKMHTIFVAQITDARACHSVGAEMSAFLLSFLGKWLTSHIMGADRRFGDYLNQCGQVS